MAAPYRVNAVHRFETVRPRDTMVLQQLLKCVYYDLPVEF